MVCRRRRPTDQLFELAIRLADLLLARRQRHVAHERRDFKILPEKAESGVMKPSALVDTRVISCGDNLDVKRRNISTWRAGDEH
jgi:hypothetical protein